jgi:hypothetical protein
MYVVIFCLGLVLVTLEIVASKKNGRTAAASPPESRWLRVYRWRYLIGAPLAIASAFISYPLSSGEDKYEVTGFPFLVMAIDQRGWDYAGFLSLPFLVINALVWLYLPSIALWSVSNSRLAGADCRTVSRD